MGGCSEGVPPWGYLVVLAGPFDGPPPTKDNDPQFAEHTRQAVEFIQAKTAEVWTPAARAKAPRLAARSTVVGYLDFPTE